MKNTLKQLTKIGGFLLIITLFFINCENEESSELTFNPSLEINPQNISFEEAKSFFIEKQKQLTFLNKTSKSSKTNSEPNLELIPDWNSFSQDSILYSSSLLTKANVEVNRSGNYSSYLYFVKKDDQIQNAIFTIFKTEVDANGNAIEAYVFFNELDGTFLDAYKIEDGAFRKKLIPKQGVTIQKASFFMFLQSSPTQLNEVDFWCGGGTEFEPVIVYAPFEGTHTSEHYDPKTDNFFGVGQTSSGVSNDPIGNGGSGISDRDIASGGGALLLNPITLEEEEKCPQDLVKVGNACISKETIEEYAIRIDVLTTPKVRDIKKELKCFNKSKPAKLTIYVEQAIENSREVTAALGHTFIGIEQNGKSRHLGFYPDNGGAANLLANQDSEIHDNSGSPYHVSITINISSSQLINIINYIENYPKKYDLNNYNCTDFGIEVAKRGGLILPKTNGEKKQYGITLFKGRNPGDLGEDVRALTLPDGANRNLTSGNAPSKSGTCP